MMDKVAKEDGILASIIEEFWYAARFEALQDIMLKILKTDRKRGGWLILVSQSPEDAISCPIFPAIVQQTPTKIFLPNPDAEFENSYERCGLTLKEFEELSNSRWKVAHSWLSSRNSRHLPCWICTVFMMKWLSCQVHLITLSCCIKLWKMLAVKIRMFGIAHFLKPCENAVQRRNMCEPHNILLI